MHGRQAAPGCACLCVARRQVAKACLCDARRQETGRRRQVAYKLWGLYPNPGAKGRALWPPTTGTPAGTGGGPRAKGGSPDPRRAGGDTRGHTPPAAHRGVETRGASGARRADSRGVQGWGRDLARPEDGQDPQASHVAHRALLDVHTGQPPHPSSHGLRRERFDRLTVPSPAQSGIEGFSRTASTTQS